MEEVAGTLVVEGAHIENIIIITALLCTIAHLPVYYV